MHERATPGVAATLSRGVRAVVLTAAALAAVLAVGEVFLDCGIASWRSGTSAEGRPDELVLAVLCGAGLLLCAWLGLAVLLSVAAAVAGPRLLPLPLAAVTDTLAPVALRRVVCVLLGTVIGAGAVPAVAGAAAPPARAVAGTSSQVLQPAPVAVADPHVVPNAPSLDPRLAPTPTVTVTGDPSPDASLDPGFRPLRPAPAPVPATLGPLGTAPRAGSIADDTVVVRRGDTLWDIAKRHLGPHASDAQVAAAWPRWYAANVGVVGGDPHHLVPGERLVPPSLSGSSSAPASSSALNTSNTSAQGAAR